MGELPLAVEETAASRAVKPEPLPPRELQAELATNPANVDLCYRPSPESLRYAHPDESEGGSVGELVDGGLEDSWQALCTGDDEPSQRRLVSDREKRLGEPPVAAAG